MDIRLTDNELERVQHHHALQKDYFYVPVITYGDKSNRSILVYQDETGRPEKLSYASKVKAGTRLVDALRQDLAKDFQYTQDFTMYSISTLDTARNKRGQTLTRLLVLVEVAEKFDISQIRPAGLPALWYNEATDSFTGRHPGEPEPDVSPTQLLETLYAAIHTERQRQNIAPDQYISLALMVDNHYIQDLISGKEPDGTPVADTISGETKSPNFLHGFMNPIGTDFSHFKLADFHKHRFDLSKPATIASIGNVQIAFIISPIDHKTGHVIKNSPQN